MKSRDYIEHNFIPWIMSLDKKDTINHIETGKEEYLCELYNHIAESFNAIEHYELYMFRVTKEERMFPIGLCHFLTCKLPQVMHQGDASHFFIVYNDNEAIYYTMDLVMEQTYQITKIHDHKKRIIGTTSGKTEEAISVITNEMLGI